MHKTATNSLFNYFCAVRFSQKWFLIKSYLRYRLQAGTAHDVHSPFVFDFIQQVLKDKRHYYAFDTINKYRKRLLADKSILQVEDFGAGSIHAKSNTRQVCEIATNAGKNTKWGKLLFRIVNYFQPQQSLELGTSLGIGTMYMAKANALHTVHTIEGSEAVAETAKKYFNVFDAQNILQHVGNFDSVLPTLLQQHQFDFIYIDGNHRYEPTIRYYELCKKNAPQNAVLIFDDIHWSKEMDEAWQAIVADSAAMLTIDIFQFGLVIFKPEFKVKQHFVLKV